MSRELQIKCDFCGTLKQETNHWYWIGVDDKERLHIVSSFEGLLNDLDCTVLDACGEKCVLSGVQNFLEKRTLTD